MAITKEVIRQCLRDKRDEIENAELVERPFYFEDNGNYVFVGVRHVGKSYMLYQRVKQLLDAGHGWDEILFVDFEDERLSEMTTEHLNLLLETHYEAYGKQPYIFLDEIQNIDGWDKFARRLANAKYHVCITGSNAKMLSKEVATTLGGRYFIVDTYPYSFNEYLKSKSINPSADFEYSTKEKSMVLQAFSEYFRYGGLPEIGNFTAKRKMLSGLYQKIYLGDICSRNCIKSDRTMNIMIKKLAESVKQPISFNRLRNVVVSTGIKTSIPTIIDYVEHAVESWLILPIENELSSLADKESQKKYYFIDNGLLNLFLINQDTSLLENIVAVHLCRLYGKENVRYWNANNEIDFVVREKNLAIQVAYSLTDNETYKREIKPLVNLVKKDPSWKPVIITYDEEKTLEFEGFTIKVIPVWKWMMQC